MHNIMINNLPYWLLSFALMIYVDYGSSLCVKVGQEMFDIFLYSVYFVRRCWVTFLLIWLLFPIKLQLH